MSEPIKSGDLVWAVRDCCGTYLGRPFTVSDVGVVAHAECEICRHPSFNALMAFRLGGGGCLPVAWLRKLNPPEGELEIETELEAA